MTKDPSMTPPISVELDLDTIEASARGELGAKSLGEKLWDANVSYWGCGSTWSEIDEAGRDQMERVALAFAASLTHDETANAVTLSLASALRAEKAENAAFADLQNEHANITQAWREAEALATKAEALAKEQAERITELGGVLERIRDAGAIETPHGWVGKPRELALREVKAIACAALSRLPAGGDAGGKVS